MRVLLLLQLLFKVNFFKKLFKETNIEQHCRNSCYLCLTFLVNSNSYPVLKIQAQSHTQFGGGGEGWKFKFLYSLQ